MKPRKFVEEYWYLIAILVLLPFAIGRITGVGFGQLTAKLAVEKVVAGQEVTAKSAKILMAMEKIDTCMPIDGGYKVSMEGKRVAVRPRKNFHYADDCLHGCNVWTESFKAKEPGTKKITVKTYDESYYGWRVDKWDCLKELHAKDSVKAEILPKPKFSISLKPPRARIDPGEKITAEVKLTSVVTPRLTTLSAENVPEKANVTFSPKSCTPDCSSLMTVKTKKDIKPGDYRIKIVGTSLGKRGEVTFLLMVGPKIPSWIYPLIVFIMMVGAGVGTIILKRKGII